MSRCSHNSRPGALLHTMVCWTRTNLTCACRTVPTNDQILVPESLLKKRKSQEKARAERSAATEKRKAVSSPSPHPSHNDVNYSHRLDQVSLLLIYIPSFGSDMLNPRLRHVNTGGDPLLTLLNRPTRRSARLSSSVPKSTSRSTAMPSVKRSACSALPRRRTLPTSLPSPS